MTDEQPREILLALVNSVEGQDEEFNDWYTNVHIPEVLAVPGFVSAQRYATSAEGETAAGFRYATVYEVEGSALQARAALFSAGLGEVSPSIDLEGMVFAAFSPLGEVQRSAS
ncbi:DUF4286 family protein [Microbacterium sp.]|uniref:DUF4286 family protein n=1 Tax=Microbacterium sp. TaxID=51671 RepID=UPI0039E640C8